MLVMNDRPQGGSAFKEGRIELMFNRRISQSDDLGMPENLNEYALGNPLKTQHKYLLKFANGRKELFNTIYRKQAELRAPLQFF
jgi:hypothetical protein